MNNDQISIESFIEFCDDMMIAEEGFIETAKNKLILIFTKLINFLHKKISNLKDSKFKLCLLKLLNRAKKCLNKSKALSDPEMAKELEEESKEIVELDKKLTTIYASKEKRYIKVEKKVFSRKMYKPASGTQVYNFLEKANYTTSESKPYVLIGSKGEEWTIDEGKLCKTYTYNGKDLTPAVLKSLTKSDGTIPTTTLMSKRGPVQWALKISKNKTMEIETSWGETLQVNDPSENHADGDYIICSDKDGKPDMNDRWVVNGEVFKETYQRKG